MKKLYLAIWMLVMIINLAQANPYTDVSLYYSFDGDTIATKCGDLTGGNNNCSVPVGHSIMSPTNCSGKSNQAWNFTLVAPNTNNATLNVSRLDRGNNYTFVMWHRPQNVGTTNYLVSTTWNDTYNIKRGISIYGWNLGNTGNYNFTWATTTIAYPQNVEIMGTDENKHTNLLNTWVFTAWMMDATNNVTYIYIGNSTDVANWSESNVNTTLLEATTNTSLYIGNKIIDFYLTDPYLEQAGGAIDEFGFWNRTLTNAEILMLYNESAGYFYTTYLSPPSNPPTTPTTMTPANNSIYFNGDVTLTCSGSTDPDSDPLNYTFRATQLGRDNFSYNVYDAQTQGGSFDWVVGSSYDAPYELNSSASADSAWAVANVGINTDNLTLNIIRADEGGGTDIEIFIDGVRVYDISNADNNKNISINTTLYNDGELHDFNISLEDTANPQNAEIIWWGEWEIYPEDLYVTSGNSFDFTTKGISEWQCRACDNSSTCSSFTNRRYLYGMNFTSCTSGDFALNLTFEASNNTGTKINGAITASTLTFDSDDAGDYNVSYVNTTEMPNFAFCMNPFGITVPVSAEVSYKASGYPTRTITFSEDLNGSYAHQEILYLLPTADGIYVTFQVVDSANSPIEDVTVTAEELIGVNYVEVGSGDTDDAGSITFWLNPDVQHKFTFSKSGYQTAVSTITPTQSTYTQTLQQITTTVDNFNLGVKYNIIPTDTVLNIGTVYNFGFNITSSNWTLNEYGFTLTNSSGDILTSASGTTGTGGLANQTFNTSLHSRYIMNYYWDIAGNTSNGTYYWEIRNTTAQNFTLLTFFEDLKNFNKGGVDNFTRTIIFIFILVILVGTLVFFAGDSEYIKYSILGLIVLWTWVAEYTNTIQPIGQQYFITLIVGLVVMGYIIRDNVR